jgi:AmmeMemoRadiSam system protein A
LHQHGELRGCIGSLVAEEPLVEDVRRNAKNAAFRDPRFSPLNSGELDEVDIEVSVLTDPVPLDYKDGADLAARLRPNIDGVIISQGRARATFLPQVWEQLPEPADFLAHLCRKAGLPMDAWQDGSLAVSTYQVQCFSEKS